MPAEGALGMAVGHDQSRGKCQPLAQRDDSTGRGNRRRLGRMSVGPRAGWWLLSALLLCHSACHRGGTREFKAKDADTSSPGLDATNDGGAPDIAAGGDCGTGCQEAGSQAVKT